MTAIIASASLRTCLRLLVKLRERAYSYLLLYNKDYGLRSDAAFHISARYRSLEGSSSKRANEEFRVALAERYEMRSQLCDVIRIQRVVQASFSIRDSTATEVIRRRYPHMALFKVFLIVSTVFLILCAHATSLAITPAISLEYSTPKGNISDSPLNSRCTNSRDWIGVGYNVEACASALRNFFFAEVRRHPLEVFEFLAEDETPRTRHSIIRTPKRYISGTCTIAIVMLDFFAQAGITLPDQTQHIVTPKSDISNWQVIFAGATRIEKNCGEDSAMGWQTGGSEAGIGIFMWATGSGMDKSVP